jgi:MYXO-CTERM domain-containing protein
MKPAYASFVVAAIAALLWTLPVHAQTFPPDSAWVPLRQGGVVLGDPLADAQGPRDIVGDAQNGAAFIYRDATHLFFRLRVNVDPRQSATEFRPYGWGVEFDSDGNTSNYEYIALVNGIVNPDEVQLDQNTQQDPGSPRDIAETPIATYPTDTHARSEQASTNFGGDPDFFVDWAIDIADLEAAGLDLSQPIRFIFGTSQGAHTLDADLLSPSSETTIDGLGSDPVICDGGSCQSGCGSDADCPDSTRPACQPSGACGECSASNDSLCQTNQTCNVASGTCGNSCSEDTDCTDTAQPACQPSGVCGECSADNQSRCTGTRPRCDAQSGVCVPASTGAGGTGSGGSSGTGAAGALGIEDVEVSGSGCGCSTVGGTGVAGFFAGGALAALLAFAARRRRRGTRRK